MAGQGFPRSVEVWADTAPTDCMRLFLSDAAFRAAESALSPVSVTDLVSRESMPPGNRLIIKGGDAPAWGLAEAEHKLSDSANNTSGF